VDGRRDNWVHVEEAERIECGNAEAPEAVVLTFSLENVVECD
jgi:hypothetical protein